MADSLSDADLASMTDDKWRSKLSSFEYNVLRHKGTEPRGGEYDHFYPVCRHAMPPAPSPPPAQLDCHDLCAQKPGEGYFACRGCGLPLYSAASKFSSGCGWPAFDKCYKDSVKTYEDNTHGMRRIEITCKRCDGHLGHGEPGHAFLCHPCRLPCHPLAMSLMPCVYLTSPQSLRAST